jgi:hypothetical protein
MTESTAVPTTVKPEVIFVEELLDEILAGALRVPGFQRPFVWQPEQMRQLFDSIAKGYPIGSLLLWETERSLGSRDKIGPFTIPPAPARPVGYILDGHQRLTTLLAALCLPSSQPLSAHQADWQWWLWYDLAKQEFVHVTNGKPGPSLLPLRVLRKTVDFLGASRNIQSENGEKAGDYIREAESLAQRIKNYKIAVTRIRGGTLADAVSIFSRLNSKGLDMTADQMVSALTYEEGADAFNLADSIDGILEEMEAYNFGGVPRRQVLQSVLAAANLDIKTSDVEGIVRLLGSQKREALDAARNGLVKAAQFLSEHLKVPGDGFLPYANQIVLLSTFFRECASPSEQQIETIVKWFWATSLTGWFAGVNPSQLRDAVDEMRDYANGNKQTIETMPLSGEIRPLPKRYDSRSARIRSFLVFLFNRQPLHPREARPLEAHEVLDESRGVTYIFFTGGVDRDIRSNPANRILLAREPGTSVRDQILNVEQNRREAFLDSHCIPVEAFEALECGNQSAFIEARRQCINAAEHAYYSAMGLVESDETAPEEASIDNE